MKQIRTGLCVLTAVLSVGSLQAQDFSNFEYRNVGPSRGGRVTAVAGTVAAPSTFYLGASGGGVWKTEDYGSTWKVVSDGYFASPSIGDIAVAQNDANIVYVGTGSDGLRSNVIPGKGVYKSIDGGATWEHVGLTNTGHIGAVEIDPTNHNVVWVAAIGQAFHANEERGVYKTEDGGKSWNKVLFISDTVGFADVELLPGNPDIVFAAAWKAGILLRCMSVVGVDFELPGNPAPDVRPAQPHCQQNGDTKKTDPGGRGHGFDIEPADVDQQPDYAAE